MICAGCGQEVLLDATSIGGIHVCKSNLLGTGPTLEEWEAVQAEVRSLKLQVRDYQILAGSLLQRIHDLALHRRSIQFCEELVCKSIRPQLGGIEKPDDASSDDRCVVCELAKPLKVSLLCSGCYEIMVAGAKKRVEGP